jgi:hypothetical protein
MGIAHWRLSAKVLAGEPANISLLYIMKESICAETQ